MTPSKDDAPYSEAIAVAREEMGDKNAALAQKYQLDKAAWNVDQETGTIAFTVPGKKPLVAKVQIICTYNPADGTLLWGWANDHVQAPLKKAALALKAYGEKHGIDVMTAPKIECEEADCWDFAALALHLTSASGVYRGPTGGPLVFMTFDV